MLDPECIFDGPEAVGIGRAAIARAARYARERNIKPPRRLSARDPSPADGAYQPAHGLNFLAERFSA
jgi:alkylation response protein AidB-like acyl-CoA dehydrogenase